MRSISHSGPRPLPLHILAALGLCLVICFAGLMANSSTASATSVTVTVKKASRPFDTPHLNSPAFADSKVLSAGAKVTATCITFSDMVAGDPYWVRLKIGGRVGGFYPRSWLRTFNESPLPDCYTRANIGKRRLAARIQT